MCGYVSRDCCRLSLSVCEGVNAVSCTLLLWMAFGWTWFHTCVTCFLLSVFLFPSALPSRLWAGSIVHLWLQAWATTAWLSLSFCKREFWGWPQGPGVQQRKTTFQTNLRGHCLLFCADFCGDVWFQSQVLWDGFWSCPDPWPVCLCPTTRPASQWQLTNLVILNEWHTYVI
jgi:hypothetical protein